MYLRTLAYLPKYAIFLQTVPRVRMLTFTKLTAAHKDTVLSWLTEPHVQEFWDTSTAHKNDILNFLEDRKTPSPYAQGRFVYWIGFQDDIPFSFIMTIQEFPDEPRAPLKEAHISKTGSTYALDYMIGSPTHVGTGLGASTLAAFLDFFKTHIDTTADTFWIDPEAANTKARHVYEKAGFIYKGDFINDFITPGEMRVPGKPTHFLVKKL